jgi:Putative Ig domain
VATVPPPTPPTILSADAATFTENAPGAFTVMTGGSPTAAISTSGSSLPSGLTLTDNGDGTATLGGQPSPGTAGTYDFTVDATNSVGIDAIQPFVLTIDPAFVAPSVTVPNLDHSSDLLCDDTDLVDRGGTSLTDL